MRRIFSSLVLFCAICVPAFSQQNSDSSATPEPGAVQSGTKDPGTKGRRESPPHHLYNPAGALTDPSSESPVSVATRFIDQVARSFGLGDESIRSIYLVDSYRTAHNGVSHFRYKQRYADIDVEGSDYTINIDESGRVLNAGGTLFEPPAGTPAATANIEFAAGALARAANEVFPDLQTSFLPTKRTLAKGEKYMKFVRGGFGQELEGKPVWFPVDGTLRPAWVFFIPDAAHFAMHRITVELPSNKILARSNLAQFQSPLPPARGLVFERSSPQPNPRPGSLVETAPPYVQRTLQSFQGDPIASPRGWVDGTQTVGNNAIAGHNPLGQFQLTNPVPATALDRNFSFPLELGPNAPTPTNFKDAATTNLFYWVNRAHDLFHRIGFDEPAGNFQHDNFGRGGIGGDPVLAFSQFGVAANASALMDNAFFLTDKDAEDGARISIAMFLAGSRAANIFTDGSYDNEIIVHEYTHGVSNRLVRNIRTLQGGAMGEAWSDFFALEFTLPDGTPVDGAYPQGEYMFQLAGVGSRTRPYSTDMRVNPLTYGDLGHVSSVGHEVHDDGEIWANVLWEARAALIKQFGEAEGRRRIRLLVIDGMKLTPPGPSMLDARDGIMLADRVNFKGESQSQLWAAFAKRGFGVTAQSNGPAATYVSPSTELPSREGKLRLYYPEYSPNERIDIVLHDANNTNQTALVQLTGSSGDLESVSLRKRGDAFYGSISSASDGAVEKGDSFLDLVPGDFVSGYYIDYDTGAGAKLIDTTVPTQRPYTFLAWNQPHFISGSEIPLFAAPTGRTFLSAIRVGLPFAFPFYGRNYRTAYVYGNGYVSFDVPNLAPCNTRDAAAGMVGVFPMFMELVYGGRGQAAENVYVSTGPGSVTIRWAAETVATGQPVNVSLVLMDDGRMLFQYGAGNTNLTNSTSFGCQSNAPLVGVSNGRGTAPVLSGYTGQPALTSVTSIEVSPPFNYSSFPVVRLESPEAGSSQQGVLQIRGIAYDPISTVTRIDVFIDGIARRLIRPTLARPDFCSAEAVRGCPNVGFNTLIDTTGFGLTPGTHTLRLRITNARGAFIDYPEQPLTFTIQPGQSRVPVGVIESPESGATVSDLELIQGYVYAPDLRILSVDVIIDGVTYGQAIYGLRREDICSALPSPQPPNCPAIGFMFALDSVTGGVQLPNGPHRLQIRARDESGRLTLFPEQPIEIIVENVPNKPPQGVLTSPSPNARLRGTVRVEGYAYDPDGRIARVDVLVDGAAYGRLTYGTARPAACETLTDVPACPLIGFEGDLDTTRVGNGAHSLAVRIIDQDGNATVVPRLTGLGMNVFIEN